MAAVAAKVVAVAALAAATTWWAETHSTYLSEATLRVRERQWGPFGARDCIRRVDPEDVDGFRARLSRDVSLVHDPKADPFPELDSVFAELTHRDPARARV